MRAIQVLIAVALAACGGEAYDIIQPDASPSNERPLYVENGEVVFGTPEDGIEIGREDAGDIGQSRQPLVFAPNGAGNPGIQPGSYQACAQGNPNQNCVIPDRKRLVWHLYGGTAAQKLAVRTQVIQWTIDMVNMGLDQGCGAGCWSFREASDLGDPDLDLVISIAVSTNGVCPGAADTTRGFICWGGQTTSVPKDNSSGLAGTYHRFADHIVPVATVDYGQIMATPGLNGGQKTNRLRQATRAILLGFAGKGLAIIGNNRCNNTYLLEPDIACVEATAEVCWLEGFGDDAGEILWIGGPNCGN